MVCAYLGAGVSTERIGLEEWAPGINHRRQLRSNAWYGVWVDIRPSEKGDFGS